MTLPVAIVGAGCAGLACALAAARAGAQVDVYEQLAEPQAASPMHVAAGPDAMRTLALLGVADACTLQGFPYRGRAITDGDERVRVDVPCDPLAGPRHPAALGITQQALQRVLLEAAQAAGARVHWHRPVDHVRYAADGTAVLHTAHGAVPCSGLALLATGAGSRLQASLLEAPAQREAPAPAWWCALVRRPGPLDRETWVLGARHGKARLVPVAGDLAGLALMGDGVDDACAGGAPVARLRRWLATQPAALRRLAALLGDHPAAQPLAVRPAAPLPPGHRGNLICVGDAARSLPPHLSQSVAQAFEDALVLGEMLPAATDAVTLARAYVHRREPRVRAICDLSRRAAQWEAAPDGATSLPALMRELAATVAAPA